MAIEWRHRLNGVDIEEPQGFAGIAFTIVRDPVMHGVNVEATVNSLGFYGNAFDILKAAKDADRIDAVVVYTAEQRCEGESEWTEAINGKLNFGSYNESCGETCIIRMGVENSNCYMTFKNRFDQKVDIESIVAFDKITQLAPYSGLGLNMQLATQEIPISADASVSAEGDGITIENLSFTSDNLMIRPVYGTVRDNSILTGNLDQVVNFFQDPGNTFFLTPQVLMEEFAECIEGQWNYTVRLKGSFTIVSGIELSSTNAISLQFDKWNGDTATPRVTVNSFVIIADAQVGVTYNFDQTFTGSIDVEGGIGVYAYLLMAVTGILTFADIQYNFDPETSFLLSNTKACPPTNCEVFMVNETLARATEAITDRCLTVKSDYYGRTDSEPYSSEEDGCGGLRILTPGLKIRQAADKQFFASMKEMYEGLRAIDNIGIGIEGNNIRIEPVEYYYDGTLRLMDILLVPESRTDIEESMIYSNIKTGYNKWEIKSIKGIDEFNSTKEYRTSIKSVNNTLEIRSNLIAAGYIIETLRTQTLVNTGNTDNTYDNDIFIVCVERDAYGLHVEQGIADNASGFFSPATAYNWRIRPLYNLMRWFRSIANGYVNLVNTSSKLFFTSGTGNYLAAGNISVYDNCGLDDSPLAENNDISLTDFKENGAAMPIYQPETISFEYPLSIKEYQNIKANPYGYINVQCGVNGALQKTFIKQIQYKPAEGSANFILLKAWQ